MMFLGASLDFKTDPGFNVSRLTPSARRSELGGILEEFGGTVGRQPESEAGRDDGSERHGRAIGPDDSAVERHDPAVGEVEHGSQLLAGAWDPDRTDEEPLR
jgi:hypothetical protein